MKQKQTVLRRAFVLGFLSVIFLAFQNFSVPESSLPTLLVNHDLYVHTDRGLETGGTKVLSYVTSLSQTEPYFAAIDSITANQSELAGLGAGLSVSGTYGSHNLWYWGSPSVTYVNWIRGELGTQSTTYFDSGLGAIDSLLLGKLLGRHDLIGDILAKKSSGAPLQISVRMNDHHHLSEAGAFFSATPLPVTNAGFSRQLAALSPEYLTFLSRGWVISGEQNPARGRFSQGLGCDRKDSNGKVSYHLDFSYEEVIDFKAREIEDLFNRYDQLDGVELDFMRSNCFFPASASSDLKTKRMKQLLDRVFAAKENFKARTQRSVSLTVRVPIDESPLAIHGINIDSLASDSRLNGIIYGYSLPYLRSQITANPLLAKAHSNLKVYFELYQITDNQSRRRPATIDEISTSAYEALNAGYDGISLFNFHYLFKENAFYKPEYLMKRFSWKSAIPLIKNKDLIKESVIPSYYFGRRNAVGDFTSQGVADSISVVFRYAQVGRRTNDKAVLRIISENLSSADKAAWDAVELNVKINNVEVASSSGAPLKPSATSSYGRDPIRYFVESEVTDWGPAPSKMISIPPTMFRNMTNKIEVIPVTDPKGFFKQGRNFMLQITM